MSLLALLQVLRLGPLVPVVLLLNACRIMRVRANVGLAKVGRVYVLLRLYKRCVQERSSLLLQIYTGARTVLGSPFNSRYVLGI